MVHIGVCRWLFCCSFQLLFLARFVDVRLCVCVCMYHNVCVSLQSVDMELNHTISKLQRTMYMCKCWRYPVGSFLACILWSFLSHKNPYLCSVFSSSHNSRGGRGGRARTGYFFFSFFVPFSALLRSSLYKIYKYSHLHLEKYVRKIPKKEMSEKNKANNARMQDERKKQRE